MKKKFTDLGSEPMITSPAEFEKFMAARW